MLQPNFAIGQLPNAAGTLYTAPTGSSIVTAIVKQLWLCNTDNASAHTITIEYIESGGAAGTNRQVLSAASIPASTSWRIPCTDPLGSNATVAGFADTASKVTYRISVIESWPL